MPKVAPDHEMLDEVRNLVSECGGISGAAALLGVERTMLWRFHSSGRAIGKNREALRRALSRRMIEKNAQSATESASTLSARGSAFSISSSSLAELRTLLLSLVAVIDAYEVEHRNHKHISNRSTGDQNGRF